MFLVNIINYMCSVTLFFRVLCNFVFPGVLSFSWPVLACEQAGRSVERRLYSQARPVRHFYFPLMKKKD